MKPIFSTVSKPRMHAGRRKSGDQAQGPGTVHRQNLYPYSKFYLRDIKDRARRLLEKSLFHHRHHRHERSLPQLSGNGSITTAERPAAFALRGDGLHSRALIGQIQEETGDIFNLEATPAEGTSYRLAMLDKKRYPDILCANEADTDGGRPLLHQFHPAAGQFQRRYLRNARAAGRPADQIHRRHRPALFSWGGGRRHRDRKTADSQDRRQLPPALLYPDADLQRLPDPRLSQRRTGDLPRTAAGNRGLLPGGRLPATRCNSGTTASRPNTAAAVRLNSHSRNRGCRRRSPCRKMAGATPQWTNQPTRWIRSAPMMPCGRWGRYSNA